MDLQGKCVLLGVTGGIAAYKMANVASALKKLGADVEVIMTENATHFITPLVFETLTGHKCMVDTFDRGEALTFDVDGVTVELSREDTLIEPMQKSGFMAESEGEMTVVLDTNLTPELIEEGYVREIISKVQNMRKDAGFEVTDHIAATQAGNSRIEAILRANRAAVMGDVLADSMEFGTVDGYTAEWDVNGEKTQLGVKKL